MKINCVIIDEDIDDSLLLSRYVQQTPFMNLVGIHSRVAELVNDLKLYHIDIVFSAIKMHELSGIELAKLLPESTRIVFTETYDSLGEGYKVDALDFIVKPVSADRFAEVARHILADITKKSAGSSFGGYGRKQYLFIKNDYKIVRIDFDNILYIEGVRDYVKFVLKDQRELMSLISLTQLESFMPSPGFMRVHRSYIANLDNMDCIERGNIVYGERSVPVSESSKNQLLKFIRDHSITK